MEWYYYLLVVYVIGLIISCVIVSKWENPAVVDKIFAVVFWPLTAVLYGIHWIHNKL